MIGLLKYYNSGFLFISESDFGNFIRYVLKTVENYLTFLVSKGNLFIPFELSYRDAAVELTAEIFTRENNRLTKFHNFFSSLEISIITDDDVKRYLQAFLFKIVQRNLVNLFGVNDRETRNIISNLNRVINKEDYYVTYLVTDRYIHRSEVDFSGKLNFTRDDLFELVSNDISNVKFDTCREFLMNLFDIIEKQEEFNKAVSFNDLLFLYKTFAVHNYYRAQQSSEMETGIHYKILFESVEIKFHEKLTFYFSKKNFPEKTQELLYRVVDEFIKELIECGLKRSPAELTRRFFPEEDFDLYINKVQYILQMLINDLIKEIRETEKIG
jgi:hypothetical protein